MVYRRGLRLVRHDRRPSTVGTDSPVPSPTSGEMGTVEGPKKIRNSESGSVQLPTLNKTNLYLSNMSLRSKILPSTLKVQKEEKEARGPVPEETTQISPHRNSVISLGDLS